MRLPYHRNSTSGLRIMLTRLDSSALSGDAQTTTHNPPSNPRYQHLQDPPERSDTTPHRHHVQILPNQLLPTALHPGMQQPPHPARTPLQAAWHPLLRPVREDAPAHVLLRLPLPIPILSADHRVHQDDPALPIQRLRQQVPGPPPDSPASRPAVRLLLLVLHPPSEPSPVSSIRN